MLRDLIMKTPGLGLGGVGVGCFFFLMKRAILKGVTF